MGYQTKLVGHKAKLVGDVPQCAPRWLRHWAYTYVFNHRAIFTIKMSPLSRLLLSHLSKKSVYSAIYHTQAPSDLSLHMHFLN